MGWIWEPERAATVAYFAYLVAVWALRIGLIVYLLPRHRPSVAISWIAVTLVHPLIGIPLYLFFGRPVMGRAGVRAHEEARVVMAQRRPRRTPAGDRFEHVAHEHHDLARLAEGLGGHDLQLGNTMTFIADADGFIDAIVREIDGARESVHLLYYIYLDDEVSRRVTGALRAAAQRGVRVRVLVDAVGSRGVLDRVAPGLREAGVEVRAALPVRMVRGKFARIDVRNHRKVVVVDDRVAITGSHNLCSPSYGQTSIGAWKDISARITGPAVEELQRVFLQDWIAERGPQPELAARHEAPEMDPHGVPILVSPAGPGHANQSFRDLIVSAINEADKRVILTTPYFVPDEPAILALRLRAQAGLDVRIVVPERTNSHLVNAATRPSLELALEAGVRVHLHRDGLLHAKALTIDDAFAIVGSGNFDRRSFDLNYELNLVVFGAPVTRSLRELQEGYIAGSRELMLAELRDRPYMQRVLDAAASVVAPLL
jgi:cardiolipin synthase